MSKNTKVDTSNILGSMSGIGSVASAHNVCHTLCLAAVSFLSIFGIAASNNLLMFLEGYSLLFWSMGIFFLVVSITLYHFRPKCMSEKLIIVNAGLLSIGFPFFPQAAAFYWTVGGILISGSAWFYARENLNFNLIKSAAVSLIVVAMIASLYTLSPVTNIQLIGSNNDKCAPQAGYTEQEWQVHMSHHPDIYKECLNNK